MALGPWARPDLTLLNLEKGSGDIGQIAVVAKTSVLTDIIVPNKF